MKMINRIFLSLFLLIPYFGLSQVDIRISIDNQEDSVYYLCKYKGSKTIVTDTLKPKGGLIRYKDKTKLPEGIYLLTNGRNFPVVEFLVGKKQKFSIKIHDLEDLNSIKVKGAKETEIYFKLMAKVMQYDVNIAALDSEKEHFPENIKKLDSLCKNLNEFEESLKTKDPDSFINLVINSLKRHGMDDYWAEFPLDDQRILTYPLIDNRLDLYFDRLLPDAELINSEIDNLITQTGDCTEVRDYLLWYFYVKYFSPKYMNLDDVYIHIVDDYFMKLEMKNISQSVVNLMADRANNLKNLKLRAKLPEIGDLYSIESEYIAVIFYDKTCKKCAQEGRDLEAVRAKHPEMTIFPVEISSGIKENILSLYDIQTTPMIYLLDRNKRIIAKRIKAGQVEQFLNID